MSKELDRRDFSRSRLTNVRENALNAAAESVSGHLPGNHRIQISRFDPGTGNPAVVRSEFAPAEQGNYVARALDHVRNIRGALGFELSQAAEFEADHNYQQTSSGAVAVHLQQLYKGIPIFCASETVRFTTDGGIKETVGCSISIDQGPNIEIKKNAAQAVLIAAKHVTETDETSATVESKDEFGEPLAYGTVDVTQFTPTVLAAYPDKADQTTIFEAGPFADAIKTRLI